ncbi:hypothetical protein [Streptomyces cacaoi]|uniref:hypothetical protein n=1 Tax=Streptomyces cacaoi TaxID=1898 RepID=UPI001FD04653|nr:hypothetical protein [Streptomyces cacaoi]
MKTPGGRTLSRHAAERLAGTGAGRPPTTLEAVDHILDKGDKGDKVKYNPNKDTIQIQARSLPGKPYVVVSGTNPGRIVTVMIPKHIPPEMRK